MVALIQTPEALGEIVNLGHTQETSICDLAVLVRELAGSRSPLVFMSYDEAFPPGFEDMQRRLPDISRAEELIGYTPSLNLRDMLIRTIDYERRS
jgi:UDP-glucose 4-epimerase